MPCCQGRVLRPYLSNQLSTAREKSLLIFFLFEDIFQQVFSFFPLAFTAQFVFEFFPQLVFFRIDFLLDGINPVAMFLDRKSTRLNSSHVKISYAVFCLKKNKTTILRL